MKQESSWKRRIKRIKMLSMAYKMIIIQLSKTKHTNPQEKQGRKKAKKEHTSTPREVKYTYTKKDDSSLEVAERIK